MNNLESDLTGKRMYSPGIIAAYLVISGIPLGLFLYGLNVRRRGQVIMGTIVCALSVVVFAGLQLTAASGGRVTSFGVLGLLVAIGIFSVESSPYRSALRRGATRARWWPPGIWLVGILALTMILSA